MPINAITLGETHSEDHSSLDHTGDSLVSCGLEDMADKFHVASVALGLGYFTSIGSTVLNNSGRCLVVGTTPAHHNDVTASMARHVDGDASTETLETTDYEVRSIRVQLKFTDCRPNR